MINSVVFTGSKQLGLRCLARMYQTAPDVLKKVITFDDSADGRSVLPRYQDFCRANGLDLYIAKNQKEVDQQLLSLDPELVFVIGWYWLFGKKVTTALKGRMLGLHNSLLPKYRGAAPLVWAILNGETTLGYSVFTIGPDMDQGDVWHQGSFDVADSEGMAEILEKLENDAVEFFGVPYLGVLNHQIKPTSQDPAKATYCAPRNESFGRIDWTKSQNYLYDFIRSQSKPYPGAFTTFMVDRLIIWRARKVDVTYHGLPGQLVGGVDGGLYAICGDDRPLLLEELEYKGQTISNPRKLPEQQPMTVLGS